ncbi:MAG TPA: thiamine phosphate synthase [Bacteroidia bacterium]|jgi:thiamine-phosphate pyrophosphorylase|nr:thiamine phosphate synthase [Bacteroidia bacterium]HRG51519.1 thiamine phosphate synthase [Bacteroidia bacterium]
MYSKIQYISQGLTTTEQFNNIHQALDAGCSWIQLRFKNAEKGELTLLAERIKPLCKSYAATFILNDHVELAKQLDADGVHLGLQDTDIATAKELLGEEKIIGGTANTFNDVMQRIDEKCTYIGLGPFRFTKTKEKLSPVLGFSGYQQILNELRKKEIEIPVYAIGGIQTDDVPDLIASGIYGIAISSLVTQHPDKKKLIKHLKSALYAPIEYSRQKI